VGIDQERHDLQFGSRLLAENGLTIVLRGGDVGPF
jgi:hypothetical protein